MRRPRAAAALLATAALLALAGCGGGDSEPAAAPLEPAATTATPAAEPSEESTPSVTPPGTPGLDADEIAAGGDYDPTKDVKITACGKPGGDYSKAVSYTVTNHAPFAQHYHVAFYVADAKGTRLGDAAHGQTWDLAAGASATDVVSLEDELRGVTGKAACTLGDVLTVDAKTVTEGTVWWN